MVQSDRRNKRGAIRKNLGAIAPRVRCRVAAELSFGDARNRVACRILDLSTTGAKLELLDRPLFDRCRHFILERRIELILTLDRRVVDCSVVWQEDALAGLLFHSAFRSLDERICR